MKNTEHYVSTAQVGLGKVHTFSQCCLDQSSLMKLTVPQPVTKFPAFYGTPIVHYHIHNSPPLVLILSQINPVRDLSSYYL